VASIEIHWNFNAGFDIHVLAGETSASLLDLLVIQDDATPPNPVFANTPPADVASVTFTPNFFSIGSPPRNGDVQVDTANGKVTVGPAPTLKSFVIEATVTTADARKLGPIPIRVLVHKAIQEMWLTPPTLTIRQGADGQRLTVLARFDDDTIGDITRRPAITWDSSDAAKIGVAVNGELTATTHPAAATITARHARQVATAQVEAKEPWSTPAAVTLVPGSAGLGKAAKVPNVLFLAEGFTAAEQPKFEALVRGIVQRLQSTGSLRPYDLAKGAANFWSAFVPSRERGTSPLYDLNPVRRGATLFGVETPAPVAPPPPPPAPPAGAPPPPPPAPYTLENVIYEVGLPTPADAAVGAEAARRSWILQYGAGTALRVTDAVYAKWQALHDHRLANEVDSAFGIANGNRPVMHERDAARLAGFNPLRTTRAHLDSFLQNLRAGNVGGPAIGSIWATQNPASPIPDPTGAGLPAGLKAGQDSSLVFMLCGGTPFSGVQQPGLILSSLRHEVAAHLLEVVGTRQLDLDPYDLPTVVSLEVVSRVAHETAHAFGLEDEYGEFTSPLRIPATEEAKLKQRANVQPGSELERSPADGRLDPAKLGKIKWLWPRVDHAGVLAAQPDPSGTGFKIRLTRGHAHGFGAGNLVRLRQRPLLDHPQPSGRLRITDVTGDVVTVTPLAGTAITPGDWAAGSVLIRPVRGAATAGDPDGPDLPLVAPIIAAHLAASSIPLDLKPGPPAPACAIDDNDVQVPLNLPAGLPAGRPRFRAQIVGLYDGGDRYYCGVYHPSGACLMRTQEPLAARPVTYLLCPVCRYHLVDRLDPTQHRVIDRDYRKRYPQL
jgi:hypothetical protein